MEIEMVTAKTITDEQIREAMRAARRRNPAIVVWAGIALGERRSSYRGQKLAAKELLAAAWNALESARKR